MEAIAQPAANEGEVRLAEESGLGAGASAASEVSMREKTVASTAVSAINEAAERDTAISRERKCEFR